MKVNTKYIILSLLLVCGVSLFSEISGRFDTRISFLQKEATLNKKIENSLPPLKKEITHRKTRTKDKISDTESYSNTVINSEPNLLNFPETIEDKEHRNEEIILNSESSLSIPEEIIPYRDLEVVHQNIQPEIDNPKNSEEQLPLSTEDSKTQNAEEEINPESTTQESDNNSINIIDKIQNTESNHFFSTEKIILPESIVPDLAIKSSNQEDNSRVEPPSSSELRNSSDLRSRLKEKQSDETRYSRYLASNSPQTTPDISNVAPPRPPEVTALPQDSGTIYPVKKTQITQYEDLTKSSPVDLRDPSNISTEIEYDINNNIYLFKTKIDNDEWTTPFSLNPDQYSNYWLRKSMSDYFKIKNAEAFAKGEDKTGFSLRDVKVNLSALDRIFGPGGVQIQPSGYVETLMGIKHTKTDNPTIPERNRSRFMFDFDTKIQVNAKASVGNKVNFDLNYDTESTFDFDTKRIKLAYEGEEDEILKYLEAGNVSMTTTNSLIQGGTSLFGIKADLQFGKLKISSVISQQESQSQTVNSQGGLQTMPFEFKADEYDENQHFFLAHYFRDNFNKGMSALPYVRSNILISKIEVWVTNKQTNLNNPRNIVAFADMAENKHIGNNINDGGKWSGQGTLENPYNTANNLYSTAVTTYAAARNISQVNSILTIQEGLNSGLDYDKLENARLLDASEYTLNEKLGFISLNIPLSSDQVLAVAYQYTMDGKSYQVGEFAKDISSQYQGDGESGALFVKLLKPVSMSPEVYTWNLMMKNVYKLGATQVQKDNFKLNITYQSDTLGTYINYIPAGKIQDMLLLRVMQLDRLNAQNQSSPDGIFDFIEGYTILPENGRIIFPVTEPFGSHLKAMIGNDDLAQNYVYQELYDLTQTAAQQIADKNKFKISGTYRASLSSSVINLNAMNVARGSVQVTSNGITLTENVDYTVDYTAGTVTIINQALIDSNANISASLEDQSLYSLKRKTLLGLNLSYDFSKDFSIGGTIMHMYEKPINMKTSIGEESLKNTLWGLNMSYRTSSQWLTNVIDQVPWITATAPSTIAFNAEFAHLIAGHYENQYTGGYSYLDDFESAKSRISILNPYGWKLSSTPSLFSESTSTNDPKYGYNRAHLAWFMIDNMFTYNKSSLTPPHIKNDKDQRSDHRVRRIEQAEIYPDRDILYNEAASITTLNLSYYPQERGPYNVDAASMNSEGKFTNPKSRWGGIMRKLDNTNFETSNIEYIEFWLMDPYAYDKNNSHDGGKLYINLGEISEDILKDGKKFYENGLPTDGSDTDVEETVWGRIPTRQSSVYAFDNSLSDEARRLQDAGLNGLTTDQERDFGIYKTFVDELTAKLSPEALARMQNDPYSPLMDPGGDNYRHYRGGELDRNEISILNRYKYYNGTEGNSITDNSENQSYATAASALPDVEDLNQDYTMNETESYYQYEIPIEPNMEVGTNKYIVARRDTTVRLPNDSTDRVTWYQFRIPVREPDSRVGNMNDIRTVRFMRMFLTDFDEETYLRFATLDLIRSEWRAYTQPLDGENLGTGTINVSAVNIEENSDKEPVSYVVPPGVSRIVDPNQSQLRQENEQAMSFQVLDLGARNARAVYKSTNYDLRRYKRLQMFTHAEQLADGPDLSKGEMTVFLRLGSDYKNNYYEYEIPLSITPPGKYTSRSNADQLAVWPEENMFDFALELLTDLKLERNREKRKANSTVSYTSVYSIYDPDKPNNKISIIGNPSLAEVSVMMIGVRNNATTHKSAEIWVNELRMTDYDEEGGWAAQANLNIGLSDIGTINLSGRKETAGFGAIDQNMQQRRNDDFSSYTISTNVDIGRLLPEKVKLSAPLFYSYSNQTVTPKYDPLDQDIKMEDALEVVETKAEKDSIKNLAQDKTITKNFSLTNVRLNINSKNPMPYDPANFTFGYAFSKTEISNPTTAYDRTENYKASLSYSYSPMIKPWEPFKNVRRNSGWSKYPKSLSFNYLPSNISFNSYITRFYTETLTRNLESYIVGGDNSKNQILTFSQNFYWDRDFSINWDFMKNLKFSMQTGTRAELENPYLEVNKNINPDDYQKFKDSVSNTIKNLGTPLSYRQTAQLTYTLPTQNIPILDWINSSANYSSEYTWDRGEDVTITDEYGDTETFEVGNTITNYYSLNFTNQLNLVNLYNKSSFLKKVNEKFDSQRSGRAQRQTRQRPAQRAKRFEREVRLNTDSATVISHGLGTKNIIVTAKEKGRTIKLKYKRLDENTIRINRKDTAQLQLSIMDRGEPEETLLYKIAECGARGLMSVRNISFNYAIRNETALSGFRPGIGDVFGQDRTNHGLIPGLGFAFGFEGGEDFFDRARENDWLILDGENINPAVYNSIRKFDIDAQLEPIKGLKINLKALHEKNNRTSYQYSTGNTITTSGGSFAMTTIALSSAFDSGNAKNGYKSNAFSKFIENIKVITNRIESKYQDKLSYPDKGFIADEGYGNLPYNRENGAVNQYSSDVLIPAFLSAYTGKNVNKISLSPFPALTAILPNWTINYDGLSSLPWFKEKFRNFRLMHSYTARYQIGSYSSHLTWIEAEGGDGWGFSQGLDSGDGNPTITPTSIFDISSVTLTEQFSPLFGAAGTFDNNLELSLRYNYGRILNLNIPAYQLVETLQKDFIIGVGYKVNEFNRILGLPSKNGYNNDLNVKVDLSNRRQQSLIRKLEDEYTEATSGNTTTTIKISAEYTMSKSLVLRTYFDRIVNTPLISSAGYPTANTNFGISLRFMLNQ